MLSTMRRGFAYVYWLPAIRMPQDHGPRVSGGQRGLPRVHTSIAVPSPIPGGGDPLPGGVEICTTLEDSLNPPQVSVRISRRFIKY
jgi:hypothetical protein